MLSKHPRQSRPVHHPREVHSGRTIADSARITVKQDPPKALAGADTLVFTGTKVTLHAKGIDTLGTIVKKEWSIGKANFAAVSRPDTAFTAPASPTSLVCVLRVTDDDGFSATDTVIVTVALHREARLDSLGVSAGKLAPAFHPDSLVYRDTVGFSVSSIRLKATLRDATAAMKLMGKALASGTLSDTLPLNMGTNSFPIAIVAEDTAYKKTYTVQVVKIDDVPPSAPIGRPRPFRRSRSAGTASPPSLKRPGSPPGRYSRSPSGSRTRERTRPPVISPRRPGTGYSFRPGPPRSNSASAWPRRCRPREPFPPANGRMRRAHTTAKPCRYS